MLNSCIVGIHPWQRLARRPDVYARDGPAQRAKREDPVGGNRRESRSWINAGDRVRPSIQSKERNPIVGRASNDIAGLEVLLQEYGQVLRDRMPEIGTEHAYVVAPSVTHANYGLRSCLERN